MAQLRIGCVVMAAGNARALRGEQAGGAGTGQGAVPPALEAVPAEQFDRTVVVSQYPEVLELAHRMASCRYPTGIRTGASVTPSRWGWGSCRRWMRRCFRWRISPCCAGRAWGAWWTFTGSIRSTSLRWVTTVSGGNPCLFPARLFPELLALQGDHGGAIR